MKNIIEILKNVGAIITNGHFVYTSGKHGSVYINKDFLYPYPDITAEVGKMFAKRFKDTSIDLVAAPAIGGTILCQWTAYYLTQMSKRRVLSVYSEKDKGTTASALESQQVFRRGYDSFIKGKRALVIEDLTTTGGSVRKTVQAVRRVGGEVVAVCVMVNRDPLNVNTQTIGVTFHSLGEFPAQAFDAKDCPLCKKKIPIDTKVGHGKKYLEEKNKGYIID